MEPDPRPGSEAGAKNLKSRFWCQIHGGLHISFLTLMLLDKWQNISLLLDYMLLNKGGIYKYCWGGMI